MIQIAIDGPAGSGKSTVAKKIAQALKITYLDTGAMYRAVTWFALRKGISPEDGETLSRLVDEMELEITPERIAIQGEDISEAIRAPEISKNVSAVSMHAGVRSRLVAMQQEIAGEQSVVMDGRDIGTKVLPNAEYKFFLVASVEERAKRRTLELLSKGIEADEKKIAEDIARRDKLDSERAVSPLKQAEDAVKLDTTTLSIDEVVNEILRRINKNTLLNGV
jgi:cytidylate kinase